MPSALIWGASGGIGSALVKTLKSKNWTVYGAARNEMNIPDEADGTYHFDANDAFTVDQVQMMVAQETETIDLIIYAAGGLTANPLEQLDPNDWQATLGANLTGAYLVANKGLGVLNKDGHLVIISAYVDKIILPRMGAYVAAKSALETMFTVLQKENRKRNLTIVRPPAVDTPFWENVPFKLPDDAMQPENVAEAIVEHVSSGKSGELNL